jgi:hypothetical protein
MINNPLRIFPYSNWVKKRHSICCPTLTLSHQKSTHMYLLQFSTDYAFPLLITSYIIGIVVLYLVVRIAVSDGTKDLRRLLFLQNNLKIRICEPLRSSTTFAPHTLQRRYIGGFSNPDRVTQAPL